MKWQQQEVDLNWIEILKKNEMKKQEKVELNKSE